MGLKAKLKSNLRNGTIGAMLSVALGSTLLFSPLRLGLERFSFDFPFVFRPKVEIDPVVILEIDDKRLNQSNLPWSSTWGRALHAKVLDRLRADGASLVVMDVYLKDKGDESDD